MSGSQDAATAFAVLQLATQLIEGIQSGLARRGFDDVRPQHGFAFVRVSAGEATVADLAAYLGVTKQAAGQIVEYLVQRGYLTREPHPRDGRARLLGLTERGWACTRAAQDAAADCVQDWDSRLGADAGALHLVVGRLALPGRIRPAW